MTQYAWATQGYGVIDVSADPNAVGQALAQIEEQRALTPRVVVDAARPDTSPLHPCFEWDDSEAAERWRLYQAASVLTAVSVVYNDPVSDRPLLTRAFVSFKESDRSSHEPMHAWMSMSKAMADPVLRKRLIEQAAHELRKLEKRFSELTELADIFAGAAQRASDLLQATA